jgi:hypothetical protein
LRSLLVVIIVLGLFLAALPTITRHALESQLSERVAPTTIGNVDLNLFTGRFSLDDLRIEGYEDSDLAGAHLEAKLSMSDLLTGDLVLEGLGAEGLSLVVIEHTDGQLIVLLAPQEGAEEANQEPVALPELHVHDFWLRNSQVTLDTSVAHGTLEVTSLSVQGFSTRPNLPAELTLDANWDGGRIGLAGRLTPFGPSPGFTGTVRLDDLALVEFKPLLPPNVQQLTLDGRIDAALDLELALADELSVAASGDVSLEGIRVVDEARELDLLTLSRAQLTGINLSPDFSLAIESLQFSELATVNVRNVEGQWLAGDDITVKQLAWDGTLLSVERIHSKGVKSTLRITEGGRLRAQGVLTASLDALSSAVDEEGEAAVFKYALGEVEAESSVLRYIDEELSPALEIDLEVDRLTLGSLDSRQPDNPTAVDVAARIGEYSTVAVAGSITPLSEQLDLALEGAIDALDLPLVSPYVEQLLGYELTAGQFDHQFDITVTDDFLKGDNKLTLRKLEVTKAEGVEPTAPLPVPLEFGLSLLRDGKGNIELDVPVEGDLNDPAVGVGQVISKALGTAMQVGGTAILKLALQPYGAIWSAAEAGLKLATQVQLKPMDFAPGSAELGPDQAAYAAKLATLLGKKDDVQLTVCGVAGAPDAALLASAAETAPDTPQNEALLQLAKQRQEALKASLVKEHGVAPKRVLVCKAKVALDQTVAGVLLGL